MLFVFDTDEYSRLGGGRVNGKAASSAGVNACRHWRTVGPLYPTRKYLAVTPTSVLRRTLTCASYQYPAVLHTSIHTISSIFLSLLRLSINIPVLPQLRSLALALAFFCCIPPRTVLFDPISIPSHLGPHPQFHLPTHQDHLPLSSPQTASPTSGPQYLTLVPDDLHPFNRPALSLPA